ncbi:hypothetical protein OH76DRAFT_1087873 [Lentinus brumalis]|uniref:Uncharacterized protein n=1 Tax=Lentinus brumalis TaxID=2498619 RepID=A0A371DPE1_9APHY|nr:hypothetical protein OH76DRAFT_1087873 [Polyporus brumalis]
MPSILAAALTVSERITKSYINVFTHRPLNLISGRAPGLCPGGSIFGAPSYNPPGRALFLGL